MMENISLLRPTHLDNNSVVEAELYRERIIGEKPKLSPVIDNLISEGGENLYHYLRKINLLWESNVLVIPAKHHFYYDENDLKNVGTLINLKKLNFIKDLDTFLYTLLCILPPNANFVGCFSEYKSMNEYGFPSRFMDRFYNFLDSKHDHNFDKNDVSDLLEKYGFKVVDFTEMTGLTYFYSKNVRQNLKIRA
jgi:hypothetical protein